MLLAVGAVSALALTVMPDAFYRLFAFPNGIAMIGLGVSLWRDQRHHGRDRRRAGHRRASRSR